jgi:hypothetical protein
MPDAERDAMSAKDQRDTVPLSLLPFTCSGNIRAVAHPMFAARLPIRGVRSIQFGVFKHPAKPLSELSKRLAKALESVSKKSDKKGRNSAGI